MIACRTHPVGRGGHQLEVEDLPRTVIQAVRKKFPDAKIAKVEEVSDEDDKVVYELAIEAKGGKTTEIVMAPQRQVSRRRRRR